MASTPPEDPPFTPDRIDPVAPPETPAQPTPAEEPMREPPEVTPDGGDIVEPGRGPDEI